METVQIISEIGAMALHAAQLRARLQKMADTDGLTGLYNKRYFLEEMDRLIDEARAKDTSIGIFMLDIDFFKKYNDTNGHPQGDMLLKGIARILKKLSESMGGIAARYGGEEFIVALPGKDKIQTIKFAEMVRQIVERTKFPHGEKQPGGRVTISGGISVFPFDGTTKEQLIEKADEALYRAKKQGKNKVFSAV
jgi:diguanylate cyclase (GGDEF)-like protein